MIQKSYCIKRWRNDLTSVNQFGAKMLDYTRVLSNIISVLALNMIFDTDFTRYP